MEIALFALVSLLAGCFAVAFYMDWLGLWVSEAEMREKREAAQERMRGLRQPTGDKAPETDAIDGQRASAQTTGRAIAFDVDAASLSSLREALPAWEIETVNGATVASLPRDWSPSSAGLLVVGLRANVAESFGLCRFLAHRNSYARDLQPETVGPCEELGTGRNGWQAGALFIVLTPSGQDTLTEEALGVGTHRRLSLPIQAGAVARLLALPRAGDQRGRLLAALVGARSEDLWRDDGGQG